MITRKKERIERMEFIIEHGLGWEDMERDINV